MEDRKILISRRYWSWYEQKPSWMEDMKVTNWLIKRKRRRLIKKNDL